jgi:hypothetical protein
MDNVIPSIDAGFSDTMFCSREPHIIEERIKAVIDNTKGAVLANKPKQVKIEPIDELHDTMLLMYENETIKGTITWRHSILQNGSKRFVFTKFN